MNLNIIYEDRQIIVIEKPPKVPSQSDKTGDKDMLTYVSEYLSSNQNNNKEPYVSIVHRLDRPVGGIMVFPKTKMACSNLNKQIQNKQIEKSYYCVVCGYLDDKKGTFVDYLKRLKTINMSKVVNESDKKAKQAILNYEVLNQIEDEIYGKLSLIKVDLITGRHHQIRLQMAHHGCPLWGDNKYNKKFMKKKQWSQIALFSSKLSFMNTKNNKKLVFEIDIPDVEPFSLLKK